MMAPSSDHRQTKRDTPRGTASRWLRHGPIGVIGALLTNEKSYSHPLIGAHWANRLGLHDARVRLADHCGAWRRARQPAIGPEQAARLQRDGMIVIHDALPAEIHDAARAEFEQVLAAQSRDVPMPPAPQRGFGQRIPNAHGFDRYDGGTLNRFIDLDDRCTAIRRAFGPQGWEPRLQAWTGALAGIGRYALYLMVHGDEATRPDLQRQIHCDTFHETYKLWYFFDAVTLTDGPLCYVPGSHRPNAAHRAWERRRILDGSARSAAMRIDVETLAALGYPPPQPIVTPPNTLLLANTRGFHCRSVAPAGTVRPCIYANLRPHAFSLRPR